MGKNVDRGADLEVPKTVVHRWEAPWGGVVAASHIGLVRENQEDKLDVSNDMLTFALADGMGGHGNGEKAALSAVTAATTTGVTSPREAVRDGLIAAHRACNDVPYERGERAPGTTLVVARLAPEKRVAWFGWAGDSRGYRYRHPGTIERITRDHTPYRGGFLAHCIIAGEPANAHENDDHVSCEVARGDILMLCSDGLCGLRRLSDAENDRRIAQVMHDNYGSREAMARALVKLALDHGGHDNITVVLGEGAVTARSAVDASGRTVAHNVGVRPDYQGGFGLKAPMPPYDGSPPGVLGLVYGPAGNGYLCPWCDGTIYEYDRQSMLARCDRDPVHMVELMAWPG